MIIHSKRDGKLVDIKIDSSLKSKILQRFDYLYPGDFVNSFKGANSAIGVLVVGFSSKGEMYNYIDNMDNYCEIILE